MNYSDRNNGALSSITQHCTPLECGDWAHHDSIDIAQDPLSRSLFSRLILWSENQTTKEHLFKVYHRLKDVSIACRMNYSDRDNGALSSV